MVKKLAEATGSITFSQRGEKGEKGDNGVGVKGFNTYYGLSRDKSSPPTAYDYDTLSDTIIKTNKDMYVWSADKVLYTDGTGDDFINAYCIGKCSDLTSVREQYGTSTSAGTKPSENSWEYTYPSNPTNGTYVWSRDEIVWAGDNSTTHTDAQLIGYIAVNGKDGAGMVVAYQQATSKPTSKPKVTSYETYKNTNDLLNNWVKTAPSGGSVLASGGSVSGVRYNQNPIGGNWQSGISDGGNSWYKSPEVGDNGIAKMQIHFTTSVDGQYVTFYIKAYSEKGYDFILVSEIDSTNVTRNSGYSTRASGNGVEESVKLKCEEAGSHFVTIAYAKDVSGKLDNYDYGLVRMATNENYVYVSTLLYRCDGDVNDGIISWGSIYQAQGEKGQKGDTGARGTKGALMREHDGFESGSYKYLSGAGEEAYVDVVCVEGKWYQCTTTYDNATSSPSLDDGHWTLMNNYKSIATYLLLAENATIKMLGSNQINLYNPSGGAMFGSFRVVDNDDDYAFWLGGNTGAAATTSITRGGKLKSTSAEITGKITATSGQIGGFKLENNNLVCSNARLVIGEESNNFTRMVVMDAKSLTYASYNFALSVVSYGIVTQSSATQAGIHINVGSSSNTSTQYPGIVMENGTFVGLRVPVVPLSYSMDLRNNASIYASGMCIRCNNSSNITITLPTSATGAKTGDVFTVIRAGTGDVTIKAPTGVNYYTASGRHGDFTSSKRYEHIQLVFDGDTWFSECSNDS